MRIGHGYDVHRFNDITDHKGIMLGGVHIACEKGLIAHSDGDVLIHALCDALLGALGLGDIGKHFPDTDSQYKNADSRELLRHVVKLVHQKNYMIGNIDTTIVAEAPKIASHIGAMQTYLAEDLHVSADCVGIKATTAEKIGFIGRGEGIAAYAVVLLWPHLADVVIDA
jgi:2-C-methyl-D-erythritol 2,4-cyclodiphosphate synthase